ncbi:hypothetical protein RG903_05570 [Thermithiobacillus tepidarius DSM 3134]|uniref:hypothetical protein n=1 Tax=Thermithiobacillus tepidarius TaxID=929 RepID=UPI0012DEADB2|nr:hypothetical protein [Thermithiobacillus tepidarius]
MSEVAALEPFGDFHSALYFRDLYLRDETLYTEFFCPFCGVLLDPVLVYAPADQEIGKSPHFRTRRGGAKHYSGCDGNSSNYQHPTGKKPVQAHIEKRQFSLPTEFAEYVDRPPRPAGGAPARAPTPDEIRRRREAAGRRYGVARFRVSLVQSLAEAHLAVLADAYEKQKEHGWPDTERQSWIREVLQAPIDLRGYSTTYRGALHDLWFPVPKYPRVFHGKHAKVTANDDGYVIMSERPGKIDDDNSTRPFVIIVSLHDVDEGQLRGARRALLRQLERAVAEAASVRWYAYGRAELIDGRFELAFDGANIGDLFVKMQNHG